MPLTHLLYRCPRCGGPPVDRGNDQAVCESCGAGYRRGSAGAVVQVDLPDGRTHDVPAPSLATAVDPLNAGAPGDGAGSRNSAREPAADARPGQEGEPLLEAPAVLRRVQDEEPLRFRGRVIGFVERYTEGRRGTLRLHPTALSFTPSGEADDVPEGQPPSRMLPSEEEAGWRWDLLDLRAVGSSSSSVQFMPREGPAVELRFTGDSPRRWEEALKGVAADRWEKAGRGRVVEFQPRIVAE